MGADVEYVKCFTLARFPFCLILSEKNAFIAMFWAKNEKEEVSLIYYSSTHIASVILWKPMSTLAWNLRFTRKGWFFASILENITRTILVTNFSSGWLRGRYSDLLGRWISWCAGNVEYIAKISWEVHFGLGGLTLSITFPMRKNGRNYHLTFKGPFHCDRHWLPTRLNRQ